MSVDVPINWQGHTPPILNPSVTAKLKVKRHADE